MSIAPLAPRLLLALALLGGSAMSHALGLRCGTRVVGDGMLEPQVRNACGAPFWIDSYASLEVLGAGGPVERQREIDWDVWYFNFGSSSLMQRLTFRDGRLQAVEALGYGVNEIGGACPPPLAARGLTTGELVARCGEPAERRRNEGAVVRRVPGIVVADEERREEWLYDDGSALLTRYLITNGRVSAVERLPR